MPKPKIDEYLMHYRNLVKIMKRNKRIVVYALSGEGKTTLLRTLQEKFEPEGWNFYDFGATECVEPFIFELPEAFLPKYTDAVLPKFDVLYAIQYSREYKEAVSGVSFGDVYRPLSDYMKEMKYQRAHRNNIGGRKFKSVDELKRAIQGE